MDRVATRRRAWRNQMPELGPWQAGGLEASYKRLKAWFNSKRVYMISELFTKCKNKHDYKLIYNQKGELVWTMVWICKKCNMAYVDYEEV